MTTTPHGPGAPEQTPIDTLLDDMETEIERLDAMLSAFMYVPHGDQEKLGEPLIATSYASVLALKRLCNDACLNLNQRKPPS